MAETSLFPFEHIGKRFERSVSRSAYGSAAAAVIDKGIDSFLEHTFFIADNDFRCTHTHQTFQPVISVNDTTIQII